jgi:hypothetical protein
MHISIVPKAIVETIVPVVVELIYMRPRCDPLRIYTIHAYTHAVTNAYSSSITHGTPKGFYNTIVKNSKRT